MDDPELKSLLNKIGMGIFVRYFHEFGNSSITPQKVIALLQNKEPFTLKSCKARTYKSRRIFREGLEERALSIIAKSDGVEQKVADEARALLSSRPHCGRIEKHKLCEAVKDIPPGAARRRWTLRADYYGHYHNSVHLSECPLYLDLSWRPTAIGSVRRVGVFRLDLTGLLRGGYIRPEPADAHGLDVRLRIFRADDGSFFVQTTQHGPRLLLASRDAEQPPKRQDK